MMETLRHGRLGLLLRTSFGSYANLLRHWWFPGEQEIFRAMYAQVGEEEQVISPPYTRTQLDASMIATLLHVPYGTSIGGVVLRQGLLSPGVEGSCHLDDGLWQRA